VANIPEDVINAWQLKNTPAVLSTVSADGTPNVIYTAYASMYDDDSFVITDHFFNKTRENILQGSKGAILFLSEDGNSSFQLKGTFDYHQQGELYEQIRKTMPSELPSHAVALLKIESVYSGGKQLC
jgi:predicted pyridoxine 5'-phosphate oxidase superfamily flavin-nucleotide-binding protein